MQIKLPDIEADYIDVISTSIVGDSSNYNIVYKTKHGDISIEEVEDITDTRNLVGTVVNLEDMIKNNKYVKFDIEIN